MKTKILLVITTTLVLLLLSVTAHAASARYIGNKRSKKLHDRRHGGSAYSCKSYIKKMANRNKRYFKTLKQARKAGYKLCKPCYY